MIAEQINGFLSSGADAKQLHKRMRILHAATDLFIAHGYKKTSMEDVARSAGVAKGTVYLYYRNKAELLLHTLALQKLQYLEHFAPALVDTSIAPRQRLRSIVETAIVMSRRMPLMAQFTSGDHELTQILREVDGTFLATITQWQLNFVAGLIRAASERNASQDVMEQRAAHLLEVIFAVATSGRVFQTDLPLEDYARQIGEILTVGVVNAEN